MRKETYREYFGIQDKTFNGGITSDTLFHIGGMGIVTINGPIQEGAILKIEHAAKVIVNGKVDDYVSFHLNGISSIHFAQTPPKNVLDHIILMDFSEIYITGEKFTGRDKKRMQQGDYHLPQIKSFDKPIIEIIANSKTSYAIGQEKGIITIIHENKRLQFCATLNSSFSIDAIYYQKKHSDLDYNEDKLSVSKRLRCVTIDDKPISENDPRLLDSEELTLTPHVKKTVINRFSILQSRNNPETPEEKQIADNQMTP